MVYRMERSMWGCALHYLLRVWWPGMVTFRPGKTSRRTQHFVSSKLTTLAFALGAGTIAWFFAGGAIGVIAAVVVPWIVFNYFIALFVYLHHTHPSLPFFDDRERWNAAIGQVACSTIVRTSPVFESLTHNIMIHTPHHVDQRIPFYRLKTAYNDLKPEYGKHILEYEFSWKTVHSIFTTCQLFDFDEQRWYRFSDF
jgi:omega-6 fatty acid desaturase (delta-12 desaturase)